MSNKKPAPLFDRAPRPACPVCGKATYSPAGIHPQCAVHQRDDARMERVRCQIDSLKQLLPETVNPSESNGGLRAIGPAALTTEEPTSGDSGHRLPSPKISITQGDTP